MELSCMSKGSSSNRSMQDKGVRCLYHPMNRRIGRRAARRSVCRHFAKSHKTHRNTLCVVPALVNLKENQSWD